MIRTFKIPKQMPQYIRDECRKLRLPHASSITPLFNDWLIQNHDKPKLKYGIVFCYMIEKHVMGWAILYQHQRHDPPHIQLFIDPACRRLGVGTELYNFAKKKFIEETELRVFRHSSQSIDFFDSVNAPPSAY